MDASEILGFALLGALISCGCLIWRRLRSWQDGRALARAGQSGWVTSPPPVSEPDLPDLTERAWEAGHAAGLRVGEQDGYQRGLAEGRAEGQRQGAEARAGGDERWRQEMAELDERWRAAISELAERALPFCWPDEHPRRAAEANDVAGLLLAAMGQDDLALFPPRDGGKSAPSDGETPDLR